MKFKFHFAGLITLLLLFVLIKPAYGQEDDYTIRLRRDFGYGAGSNVRGTFTISLVGDESRVSSVDFLINDELMASIQTAPFRYQFHTSSYGLGVHQLSARVFLLDGNEVQTRSVGLNFISAEDERGSLVWIFGGIGLAIIVPLVIIVIVQLRSRKRKPLPSTQSGERRNYGILGGTICKKCGRAFPSHIWGLNLVTGRYDRCDHCGKWSFTVRATPEELRAAEETFGEITSPIPDATASRDTAYDTLEDTKYFDQF